MSKQLQVCFPGGQQFEVSVGDSETVLQLREAVERQKGELPPATFLKLLQGGRVLLDDLSVAEVKQEEIIVAVVTRETRLEMLLHASGHCSLYADVLSSASRDGTGDGSSTTTLGPLPTILKVLEEMSGEAKSMEHLKPGAQEGWLEFYGDSGDLLLPSLAASPLLAALGSEEPLSAITLSIGVNSDAFNQGLGVVIEASTLIDVPADFSTASAYTYNGYGLQNEGRRRNAVKFHPGMSGGQLRVEGAGGFGNQDVGFAPKAFSESGSLHTIVLKLCTNGVNMIQLHGSDPGQQWQMKWKNMMFDGLHIPALYAWLDLGSRHEPVHFGHITLLAHFGSGHLEE